MSAHQARTSASAQVPEPHPASTAGDQPFDPALLAAKVTVRRTYVIPLFLFAIACVVGWFALAGSIAWYGTILLAYLGTKLALSVLPYREPRGATPELGIGVVITVYNEDPDTLTHCLNSIYNQTLRPHYVVVVDDASESPVCANRARALIAGWGRDLPGEVIVHEQNAGKREALGTGFTAMWDADIYLCIDSDCTLDSDAVRQGMRSFLDEEVVAVTGVAIASNHRKNMLTRLIDLRYVNAFLGERAAYSRFGSVLCVTGVLAFWKGDLVRTNLERFLGQTFLGAKQTVGDDRHMTNLLQSEGKVVLARKAVASTVVPERIGHYVRQQARWGRSFWRESFWALRHLPRTSLAWWLSGVEVIMTATFTIGLLMAILGDPLVSGEWHVGSYLQWVCIGAWARSVHAFTVKREGPWIQDSLIAILAAPLFGLLTLVLILPLRVWALITIKRTAWGTRQHVEVVEHEDAPALGIALPSMDAMATTIANLPAVPSQRAGDTLVQEAV